MNTYAFPLGTDHIDYDATRVAADLRAQRGSGAAASLPSGHPAWTSLVGSVRRHTWQHGAAAHTH